MRSAGSVGRRRFAQSAGTSAERTIGRGTGCRAGVCLPRRAAADDTITSAAPWTRGTLGEQPVRAVFVALAVAILASGCGSDDKPAPAASKASSEEILKRDCADPKWREQNLGLWYSVCRQPMRW
jgi:hypothetical protein